MNNIIELWKPIEFNEKLWLGSDTSNVDNLVPSWLNKRESLQKENGEYSQFITRLKRQHAIETGIIEKLYDLSIGVTETFIKEGFIESYLGHDDTNIPPQQLLGYLTDHFFAMDFIFDLVKNDKPLTKGFIKELHGLITKQQETITAVDPFGKLLKIPLLRGEFKTNENNPRRVDGTIIRYCPPIHVDSEIEKLVQIFQELCSRKINVVITSAWFHHAFTQIHPFQDGNGRIARLLSSLIFIKEGLFPFTVKRNERTEYIQALEFADLGQVEKLVSFFGDVQKNNIEAALNYKQEKASNTILEAAKIFGAKVEEYNQQQEQARKKRLENNRNAVFDFVYDLVFNIQTQLHHAIPREKAAIKTKSVKAADPNYFWYTKQIAEYATRFEYYFNKFLPRAWSRFSFVLTSDKRYDLIITIHHYGYEDSVLAIGSFMEFINENMDKASHAENAAIIPLPIKPLTISLEADIKKLKNGITDYINDVVRTGLMVITNEIS